MQKLVEYYLAGLVACLPIYLIRFHIGWYPTTLLEVLWLGFVLLTIFYHRHSLRVWGLAPQKRIFLPLLLFKTKQVLRSHWLLMISLAGFLLASILSMVVADNLKAAFGIEKAYVIEPIILFLLLQTYRGQISFYKPFLRGSSILIVWLCGLSLIQIVLHHAIFAPDEAKLNRATGVFTTANALGLLLGPFGALFSGLVFYEKYNKQRWWYIGVIVLCAATLILSQSLTALLALIFAQIVMLFLYLFCYKPSLTRQLVWLAAAGIMTYVLLTICFLFFFLPRLAPTVYGPNLPSDSLAVRFYLWRGATAMLKEHPAGVGFSSFPLSYAPYRIYPDDNLRKGFSILQLYPHNILLNFWSEMGILGAASFLGICFWAIKTALIERRNAWGLGLLGAFIYIFIHGFSDVPYFKNDLAMAFWLLAAFVYMIQLSESYGE